MGSFQADEIKNQARARRDSTVCPRNIPVQLCPKCKSHKRKPCISAQLHNRQSSLLPQSLDYRPSFFLHPQPSSSPFRSSVTQTFVLNCVTEKSAATNRSKRKERKKIEFLCKHIMKIGYEQAGHVVQEGSCGHVEVKGQAGQKQDSPP